MFVSIKENTKEYFDRWAIKIFLCIFLYRHKHFFIYATLKISKNWIFESTTFNKIFQNLLWSIDLYAKTTPCMFFYIRIAIPEPEVPYSLTDRNSKITALGLGFICCLYSCFYRTSCVLCILYVWFMHSFSKERMRPSPSLRSGAVTLK